MDLYRRIRLFVFSKWEWFSKHAESGVAHVWFYIYAFFEALILPFPTEPFFALLIVANRRRVVWLVIFTTLVSVLGGATGYAIGYYFSDFFIEHILSIPRFSHEIDIAMAKISTFAFLAVFLAAMAPIPFTPVILSAGLLKMDFALFIAASIIGRGIRYSVVALFVLFFGTDAIERIRKNLLPFIAGLLTIVLCSAIILFMLYRRM